jgi:predicted nucleotide-binding protein (sugar kinase/HSP70/actin superfamily)
VAINEKTRPAPHRAPAETEISARLADEEKRLLDEAGIATETRRPYRRPVERPFTRRERDRVTLLFGGLTLRHEKLLHAGLSSLGYRVGLVSTPTKADFQAGREYGNNGQCNPTYFTVGALVNHLKRLRDEEGLPAERILDDYVFLTAGACGPCRFGMYEAEYRLALRNSGFDGFRVLLFQQTGGLGQADGEEPGFAVDTDFLLTFLNAILIGDLLNEVAYQVRPYEVEPGATDRALDRCIELVAERLREREHPALRGGLVARLLARASPVTDAEDAEKFLRHLSSEHFTGVLAECAALIDREVEVDFTRPKPIVKITGEFWAQTTEGDGNFRMFSFLESQGAEVLVEPVTTWVNYLLAQARMRKEQARGTKRLGTAGRSRLGARVRDGLDAARDSFTFGLYRKLLDREYERLRRALGGTAHAQVSQLELQRIGHPFYDSRSAGGEGHLEVAKNIYYSSKDLAHMVLSLKPFGCMPSTQSDGAQAAVTSEYPDMIFLPIETSGEGDVNAHSRVQMALGEAKVKCREEFKSCVERTGFTIEEIRTFVAGRPDLRRPLRPVPHAEGVVGKAAKFALQVGALMKEAAR